MRKIIVRDATEEVIFKGDVNAVQEAITAFGFSEYIISNAEAATITVRKSTYNPARPVGNRVGRFVRRAPNASALVRARREAIHGEFMRLSRMPLLHWGYTGRNAADGLTGFYHWLYHLAAATSAGITARRTDAPIEAMQQIEADALRAQFLRIRDGNNLANWRDLAVGPNTRIHTDAFTPGTYALRTLDGSYNPLSTERIPATFNPELLTLGL